MSDLFANCMDEPKPPKSAGQRFFERWVVVIVCYSLSAAILSFGVWGKLRHYPELSELRHVSGELQSYSVIDGFRNHRITLKLQSGEVFEFGYVSFFPQTKAALSCGKQIFPPVKNVSACGNKIELWVDTSSKPGIWQLSIDNTNIMLRDAIVSLLKNGVNSSFRNAFYLFIAGSAFFVLLKSKLQFIEKKIIPAILIIISILSIIASFYFGFIKGGILGK